jgi:hypothetical protein
VKASASAILLAALWASCACVAADARVMSESDSVRTAALQELIIGTHRPFVCLSVHPGIVAGSVALSDLSDARDPSPELLQDANLGLDPISWTP